jgi:hypothetical protein
VLGIGRLRFADWFSAGAEGQRWFRRVAEEWVGFLRKE